MFEFIIKFVCIVGLPLFFLAGLLGPLIFVKIHKVFDVEQREMEKQRKRRALAKGAPRR